MNRKRIAGLVALTLLVAGGAWLSHDPGPASAAGPFVPTEQEQEHLGFYSQPESWFLDNLQGPREVVDGQTLDPKFQYMMEQVRPSASVMMRVAPAIFATPAGRRWLRDAIDREWQLYTKVSAPMRHVEDRDIPGRDGPVRVRIYQPQTDDTGPLPVLVYAHGGGWVFASIAALDRVVRLIANEARVIVVSVEFRLAPEHPYPAASDDAEDAYLWARANAATFGGDPERVAVGGDSAGGYASINTVQRQIAAGRPLPRAMLLYYPGTGLPAEDRSYALFGQGYGLDSAFIDFILPRVFPGMTLEDERDDFMDPVRAKSLRGFPPTIVATAGFDILRDSGRAFARRIAAEGADVRYTNYPSLIHSFLQFSGVVADAERATTENARLLGETLRSGRLPPHR